MSCVRSKAVSTAQAAQVTGKTIRNKYHFIGHSELQKAADWLTALGHSARNGLAVHFREITGDELPESWLFICTRIIQAAFREPRLLIVLDPAQDHQPITEASYVNIPVIALCNTDSPLRFVDIAIPCNTKKLWLNNLEWDSALPPDMLKVWLKFHGGGCSAPVGVSTTLKQLETEYKLSISGAVWSLDGKTKIHHKAEQTFAHIERTAKHRLSPTEETDGKKLKTGDENPVETLNRKIDENVLNMGCEDTRTAALMFCGMTGNLSMPIEVIVKCEDLGKDLAESLISKGALEVMQVTKDLIHSSIDAKRS